MVTREGKVAVRHWNSNGVAVHANGNLYHFTPQFGASIAWVLEVDVPALLVMRTNVCCNQTKQKFDYAEESAVKVWETGRL